MTLNQAFTEIEIATKGEGFTNLTSQINSWIRKTSIKDGIINIMALHTSCSLTINENADYRVLEDLSQYLKAIVPEKKFSSINNDSNPIEYSHKEEGLDDMPAHIKTSLTSTTLSLSIQNTKLVLGTWQAVYLWEHRYAKNNRKICLHAIGEFNKMH